MTSAEFKSVRKALGLTQQGLSDALGLGKNGARTIQRIEAGAPITGPMALAMQALQSAPPEAQ